MYVDGVAKALCAADIVRKTLARDVPGYKLTLCSALAPGSDNTQYVLIQ